MSLKVPFDTMIVSYTLTILIKDDENPQMPDLLNKIQTTSIIKLNYIHTTISKLVLTIIYIKSYRQVI